MVGNVPGGPLAQLLPEARIGGELPQAIRGLFQVGVGPEQVGLGEYPLSVLDGNQLLIHQQQVFLGHEIHVARPAGGHRGLSQQHSLGQQ